MYVLGEGLASPERERGREKQSEGVLKEPTLAVSAARSHTVLRTSLLPLEASGVLFRLIGTWSWRLKACQFLKHKPIIKGLVSSCSVEHVYLVASVERVGRDTILTLTSVGRVYQMNGARTAVGTNDWTRKVK